MSATDFDDVLVYRGEPSAGLAGLREALNACGQRRVAAEERRAAETERVGALAALAELAGVRVNEVAERTGVSRQTVHSQRGAVSEYRLPLDTRVLAALLGPQARTDVDLVGQLARGPIQPFQVEGAINDLEYRGDLRRAGVLPGEHSRTILKITVQGQARFPLMLWQATAPPSRRWVVCVASSEEEASSIEEEGSALLGADQVMVIPRCTSDMTGPEVAFVIEADDDLSAWREAASRMAELRQRVGGDQDPPVVRAIIQRPRA